MANDIKRKILTCPLLSAAGNESHVCMQENCAWYMAATKTCAMYVMAHDCILNIKSKQGK